MICPYCDKELHIFPLKKYFAPEVAERARAAIRGSLAECQHCVRYYIIRNAKVDLDVTEYIKEGSNG